jgi:hypothetical protein
VLTRQRDRWQRGLLQSLAEHRVMLLNPKYGRIGMVAYPYFWFMEGFGPVGRGARLRAFTVDRHLRLGGAGVRHRVPAAERLRGVALSLAAVGLEELSFRRYTESRDFARLLLLSVIENFGYRQYLALARFKGVIMAASAGASGAHGEEGRARSAAEPSPSQPSRPACRGRHGGAAR